VGISPNVQLAKTLYVVTLVGIFSPLCGMRGHILMKRIVANHCQFPMTPMFQGHGVKVRQRQPWNSCECNAPEPVKGFESKLT